MLDEESATLIFGQALFQTDLAAFDVGQDLLEFAESFLEGPGGGLAAFGHARDYMREGLGGENRNLLPDFAKFMGRGQLSKGVGRG
jgi:hypothetical protein